MTYTDGPPASWYEPPEDAPECPVCDEPLIERAESVDCSVCSWTYEPDYEAIVEARQDRLEDFHWEPDDDPGDPW